MDKELILSLSFILTGISFLIMSVSCIKNKWIVFIGTLLFIIAIVVFLVGFSDVIFVDTSKIGE